MAVPYLLERRSARLAGVDLGVEDESLPWFAPVRGLLRANGVPVGQGGEGLILDLDPDARPMKGVGPMVRVLAPPGARSPDVNRVWLDGGEWEMVLTDAAGTGAWARRPIDPSSCSDAEALIDHATTRGIEALDEGWEAMVAGEPPTPLPRPLIGGRFRSQETFVSWAHPAERVAARIRAAGGPWGGARSYLGETAVYLLDATVVAERTDYEPGAIVRMDQGLEVATGRGVVRVERLRPGWRPARAAGDYARESGLSEGYLFV